MRGTIKRIVRDRGFGFIRPDGGDHSGGDDLFFHRSSVSGGGFDTLLEGRAVEYEEGSSAKGPRAESVREL